MLNRSRHRYRDLAAAALLFALSLGVTLAPAHPSSGIVVNQRGAVFFADERRNIIFRIDSDGRLSRWITGKHCHELFLDADGNLYGEHLEYLSEKAGWRSSIWRRNNDGEVKDVYGPAAGFPPGLLLDAQGNRYQSNGNDNPNGSHSTITRRLPDGSFVVLAGAARGSRDGRGTQAQLGTVVAMAWGPDRAIYFTEPDALRRVTMEGAVTTLARGFRGPDDSDLPTQRLWGLTVDSAGTAYVADYGNRRVLKVTPKGRVSTVLRAEKPWSPTGVALKQEVLFVLEHGFTPPATSLGPRVRRLAPDGTVAVLTSVSDSTL